MEKQRTPFSTGDIVQHFKRGLIDDPGTRYLYEIVGIARHSESDEPYMVYKALYGSQEMWVRPLAMFMGRVDKEKYPDARQEYRFELANDLSLRD